jgi:hypothetical protein
VLLLHQRAVVRWRQRTLAVWAQPRVVQLQLLPQQLRQVLRLLLLLLLCAPNYRLQRYSSCNVIHTDSCFMRSFLLLLCVVISLLLLLLLLLCSKCSCNAQCRRRRCSTQAGACRRHKAGTR